MYKLIKHLEAHNLLKYDIFSVIENVITLNIVIIVCFLSGPGTILTIDILSNLYLLQSLNEVSDLIFGL